MVIDNLLRSFILIINLESKFKPILCHVSKIEHLANDESWINLEEAHIIGEESLAIYHTLLVLEVVVGIDCDDNMVEISSPFLQVSLLGNCFLGIEHLCVVARGEKPSQSIV